MTKDEAMGLLESWSDSKMRDVNLRHGASENNFGVNLSKIRGLAKEIKSDHDLGLELWKTGQDEARLLATLILKPKQLSTEQLDAMAQEISYFKVADWLGANILKNSPHRDALREPWMASDKECVGRIGWSLATDWVKSHPADAERYLDTIEVEMKQAPFRKQETMNFCLIEIGVRYPELRDRAIDIGYRLEVLREYPVPKGCVGPFAPMAIAYFLGDESVKGMQGSEFTRRP
jgi:3-methyladenine DNA glycosylase AlkD